jgi:hypothetical protein
MDARHPLSSTPSGLPAPGAARLPRRPADLSAPGVGLTGCADQGAPLAREPELADRLEVEPQRRWLRLALLARAMRFNHARELSA